MPAAYRERISALRLTFLGVLGDSEVEEVGEPGYRRFTSAETAFSKVKIKLPSALKACGSQCPIGAYNPQIGPPLISVAEAVSHLLKQLNSQPAPPDPNLTTKERDIIIRARHAAGVSQAELARQFGISYQRVHQIVHGKRK